MLDSFAAVRPRCSIVQIYDRIAWFRVKLMGDLPYAVEATVSLSEYEISVMYSKSYF
jgi:hypothetical protein